MFSAVTSDVDHGKRALFANNYHQASDIYQTVEALQIILLFVSGVAVIYDTVIIVDTVML